MGPESIAEIQMNLAEDTELFLTAVESSFTPEHHFFVCVLPIRDYHDTTDPPDLEQARTLLTHNWMAYSSHDIFELCGGGSRTSHFLISRRQYEVVLKFHLVVGVDLLDPKQEANMWKYINTCKPQVAIMSTPCTGMAGCAPLSKIIINERWSIS